MPREWNLDYLKTALLQAGTSCTSRVMGPSENKTGSGLRFAILNRQSGVYWAEKNRKSDPDPRVYFSIFSCQITDRLLARMKVDPIYTVIGVSFC
jgi:hypothetical protein